MHWTKTMPYLSYWYTGIDVFVITRGLEAVILIMRKYIQSSTVASGQISLQRSCKVIARYSAPLLIEGKFTVYPGTRSRSHVVADVKILLTCHALTSKRILWRSSTCNDRSTRCGLKWRKIFKRSRSPLRCLVWPNWFALFSLYRKVVITIQTAGRLATVYGQSVRGQNNTPTDANRSCTMRWSSTIQHFLIRILLIFIAVIENFKAVNRESYEF